MQSKINALYYSDMLFNIDVSMISIGTIDIWPHKPVSPLVIPMLPNLPLMGEMSVRDELMGGARVDLCGRVCSRDDERD